MGNEQEPQNGLETRTFRQFKEGKFEDFTDIISPEIVIRLHWPGQEPTPLLAFPDKLEQLALGHAALEFCAPDQCPKLVHSEGMDFYLEPAPCPVPEEREPYDAIDPNVILKHMAEFLDKKGRWDDTGCFHRAAVFDPKQGRLINHVEDIGRHNCMDRTAGWLLENNLSAAPLALYVSARATKSLVSKIAHMGFPLVISRSAVTLGGIARAQEANMTLLGFARITRFTVFNDPEGRILPKGE